MISKKQDTGRSSHGGDALLVALVGVFLAYLILLPHTFPHTVHWVIAIVGGAPAYFGALGWFRYRLWKERREFRSLPGGRKTKGKGE